MRVFSGIEGLPAFKNPVVTVGSYDGVHRGHRVLLDVVIAKAGESGGESIVITFSPHPREVLAPQSVKLLNTLPEKIRLLEDAGIDNLIVIPFDKKFSRVPYDKFVRDYLVDKVGMKIYVAGYNHHFGAEKHGGPDSMSEIAAELGFEYCRVPRCDVGDSKVSSTVVREYIGRGDMAKTAELLGYNYFVMGALEDGCGVKAGSKAKLLPPAGTYNVAVSVGGHIVKGQAEVDDKSGLKLADDICSSISSIATLGAAVTLKFL